MTTTDITEPEQAGTERWLGDLGYALDRRIDRLQKEYLAGSTAARADVARLRRGLGKPTGSVPEIWDMTVGTVPGHLQGEDDRPSRAEQAAHAALTLYALHQQSRTTPMRVPGVSFGTAVRKLRRGDHTSEEAVTRRFMAVATAETVDELLVHVRGLITQLKTSGQGIGLDYAQFADDIFGLLTPGRANAIRLAWGRNYYRTTTDENDDDSAADSTAAG